MKSRYNSFMVAKPSIRREKPSLNPSRSVVMSPLLSQDWQLKGDGVMQCADCIGWNYGNEGNVTPEGGKRLCSPKYRTDGVYFLLLMLLKFLCVINAYKMFLCIFFYLL